MLRVRDALARAATLSITGSYRLVVMIFGTLPPQTRVLRRARLAARAAVGAGSDTVVVG